METPQQGFDTLFTPKAAETQFKIVFETAIRGNLVGCPVRSVCWKLFLNALPRHKPVSEWKGCLQAKREAYTALYKKLDVRPDDENEDEDLTLNNPLSQDDNSTWKVFWANEEVKREIDQDLERTHPEIELFQEKRILDIMQRVLFVHAKENPESGYRQGMHEILAPIVMLVDREALNVAVNTDLVSCLLDERYIEADSYILFSAVMEAAHEWFMVTGPPSLNHVNDAVLGQSGLTIEEPEAPPPPNMAPVLLMGQKIQNGILKQFDIEIFRRLKALEIEPQLYSLKWVRLLLSREFHLEDVIILWDAIFAVSTDLDLLPFLCAAMLRFIREFLLTADQMFVMKRLLKFPPIESVGVLVQQAIVMRDGKDRACELFPHLAESAPKTVTTTAHERMGPVARSKAVLSQAAQSAQHAAQTVAREARSRSFKSTVQRDLDNLRSSIMRQGNRMDEIIATLQREIFGSEPDEGVIIYALAELKQIRDILSLSIEDNVAVDIPSPPTAPAPTGPPNSDDLPPPTAMEKDPLGVL